MLDQVSREELAEALREVLDKHFKTYRDAGANRRRFARILERYDNEPKEQKHDPDRLRPIEVFVGVAGSTKANSSVHASTIKDEVEHWIKGYKFGHVVSLHALVPLAPPPARVTGVVLKDQA